MVQLIRQTFRDSKNLYIFVAVLFLVGVVFGALMVNALSLEQQQDLSKDVSQLIHTIHSSANEVQTAEFFTNAFDYVKWVALIVVLGLSVIGLPFILVLNFVKGVLIGFAVGLLVSQFSWQGLGFALASIAPQNFVAIPVLLIVSVAAITFSMYMLQSQILLKRSFRMKQPFLTYMTLTVTMAVVLVGIAAFETWVSPTLMLWAAQVFPKLSVLS